MASRYGQPKHAKNHNNHTRQQARDGQRLVGFMHDTLEFTGIAGGCAASVVEHNDDLLKAQLEEHASRHRMLALAHRVLTEKDTSPSAAAADAFLDDTAKEEETEVIDRTVNTKRTKLEAARNAHNFHSFTARNFGQISFQRARKRPTPSHTPRSDSFRPR